MPEEIGGKNTVEFALYIGGAAGRLMVSWPWVWHTSFRPVPALSLALQANLDPSVSMQNNINDRWAAILVWIASLYLKKEKKESRSGYKKRYVIFFLFA